jgi:hypothetical protein
VLLPWTEYIGITIESANVVVTEGAVAVVPLPDPEPEVITGAFGCTSEYEPIAAAALTEPVQLKLVERPPAHAAEKIRCVSPVPEFCWLPTADHPAGALMVALLRTAMCAMRMSPLPPGSVGAIDVPGEASAVFTAVRAMFGSITYGTGSSASSNDSASVHALPLRATRHATPSGVTLRRASSKIAAGWMRTPALDSPRRCTR